MPAKARPPGTTSSDSKIKRLQQEASKVQQEIDASFAQTKMADAELRAHALRADSVTSLDEFQVWSSQSIALLDKGRESLSKLAKGVTRHGEVIKKMMDYAHAR